MRLTRSTFRLILGSLAVAGQMAIAAPGDGYLWEYTNSMNMSGMDIQTPPTQLCQPVKEPQRVPPMQGDCTMDKLETKGNTTYFEMSCGSPREMKASGSSTVTETTLEGSYTMVSAEGEMKMQVRGERMGPCDTAAPPPAMKGMPPGMMPPGVMPPR